MKIIFVRHGKTIEGAKKNWLVKRGRIQANFLAKRLKEFKIDKVYSSDLARAKQTAKIISKELKLPITLTSDLREYKIESMRRNKKDWESSEIKQFNELKSFLKKISKKPDKTLTVLLVCHGFTNRFIISHFLNINHKKLFFFRQKNTGINIVYWANKFKNWRLDVMNDFSHLQKIQK
ncbi:phosphoserine phosphatase 1 [archaeon BMS3Abin17]|nr:phosphoserine phosphatase 1 [archaeon BMS3Abin17]HDZ60103.1 histidine phosphatase family protein [Candidatus Pacearchaeota archaeon]